MNRSLLWPTILAICGLSVLVSLGIWQLQRLAWKEGLIARIEARVEAPPVSPGEALRRYRKDGDIEYLRLRLDGVFDHARERHLYTVNKGKAGWRIITPLRTPEGRTVLIDRGFVPEELKDLAEREDGQIEGKTEVTGLVRLGQEQPLFAPDNEPARNIWYWRDLEAMAANVSPPGGQRDFVPFLVEAEESDVPGGWPRGGVTRLKLPNRHLEYALTWFGLALALLGVYCAFVWSTRKQKRFT